MYTIINFKTKKALKEAVSSGAKVTLFAPGIGWPKEDGLEHVCGPHYPAAHTWYAEVTMENGFVTKVK